MTPVQQTQYIPLDEAICFIIHDLNCSGHTASVQAVRDRLRYWYRDMAIPDDAFLLNILQILIDENKIYYTGILSNPILSYHLLCYSYLLSAISYRIAII